MKHLIISLMLLISVSGFSQTRGDEEKVKKVVVDFFDAFHQQDSVSLRNLTHPSILMQSVSISPAGETRVIAEEFGKFLNSIVSIPPTTEFEEKLHSFDVTINGVLATVITPFSFYINGKLTHCGVNSFNLLQMPEGWKIVHIIDTRIKENCAD